jgi:hypothetical protein
MSASIDAAASDELRGALGYRFGDAEFDESDVRARVVGRTADLEPRPLQRLAGVAR